MNRNIENRGEKILANIYRDTLDFPPFFFFSFFTGELCLGDSPKEIVAIKVLKETASREAEEDFMREVDIMSTFGHRNILSLKGVVLREGSSSPWMVFEYMPYGDLAEVLRSNSPQFGRSTKPGLPQPLTQVNFVLKLLLLFSLYFVQTAYNFICFRSLYTG